MANFRVEDQNSNAYARYPVKSVQNVGQFNNTNWSVPQKIAESQTIYVGSKISKIVISSTDSIDNVMMFWYHDGNELSPIPFAFEAIPSFSGTGQDLNKIPINVLRSSKFEPFVDYDNNGNTYLFLEIGSSIYANLQSPVSENTVIQTISWLDDY